MAGFVSRGNNSFQSFTVTGDPVYNGQWVDITYTADGATGAICAAAPTVAPLFVQSEIDTVEEEAVNDSDFNVKAGGLAKAKRILPGESVKTTFVKAADNIAIGDKCVVSAGVMEKIPAEGTFVQHFVCADIYVADGVNLYQFDAID